MTVKTNLSKYNTAHYQLQERTLLSDPTSVVNALNGMKIKGT